MNPPKKFTDFRKEHMFTKQNALDLLHDRMQNQNLRRHCYAVGKVLAALHDYYQEKGIPSNFVDMGNLTKEGWEIVGILHDADWEITAKGDETNHTKLLLDWVKDRDMPEEMLNVFKSHNNKITGLREPQTLLEWTLECLDELTGFIVAVALMMPSKKLEEVSAESVIKKFAKKDFAKAVNREQITQCEQKLGISVNDFVSITLKTMQSEHELLGL
jgi:predicted hydrolase (HD superfamily)